MYTSLKCLQVVARTDHLLPESLMMEADQDPKPPKLEEQDGPEE